MPSRLSSRLLFFLVLGVVVIGCNSFVLSPILADVAQDLGTDAVTIARVISAYGAATALSSLALSGLADRWGTRLALTGSAAVLAGGLAASALAPSWPWLVGAQALAGLGGGVMLPAIYATATGLAPPGQGSRVLGRVLTGWSLSLVAGVPASAFLSDLASWRLAYGVLAGLALSAMLGFRSLPVQAPRPEGVAGSRIGAVLRQPRIAPLLAVCLCFMAAFYGTYALIGDHLRTTLGIDAAAASTVVLAYGLGFGLSGALAGLVDRLGPHRLFAPVLLAIALVYLGLPWATSSLPLALAGAFVWGGFNHVALNILVQQLAQANPGARGQVLGLNGTATYTAVFLGPMLMGVLYGAWGFGAVARCGAILVFGAAAIETASRLLEGKGWSRSRRRP